MIIAIYTFVAPATGGGKEQLDLRCRWDLQVNRGSSLGGLTLQQGDHAPTYDGALFDYYRILKQNEIVH